MASIFLRYIAATSIVAALCATITVTSTASAQEGPVGPLEEQPHETGESQEAGDENGGGFEGETDHDVVITGTGIEKVLEEAPVRTQVINSEQIETRKARNLAEAVRHTAGVRIETNCQNCGFTQLRLNGLGGQYTQVLIDGLPSFSGLAGVYGLEQIPTEMIERIEIVKGGGSALYGGSAVAGVLNIITRAPKKPFGNVSLAVESWNLEKTGVRLNGNLGYANDARTVSMYAYTNAYGREGLDLNGDGFTELTRLRQLSGGMQTNVMLVEDGELSLGVHGLFETRRGGDNLDLQPHDAALAEDLQTERIHMETRWKHTPNPTTDYSAAYIYALTDRHSYYGGAGEANLRPTLPDLEDLTPDAYDTYRDQQEARELALGAYGRTLNPVHIADLRSNIYAQPGDGAWGYMTVTMGLQLHVDDIEDRYLAYERSIDQVYTNVAGFLQHTWLINPGTETILGLRIDQHSALANPVLSPRFAAVFDPLDWLKLRSAVSTGFRAPQVFDEDLHIETVGGTAALIENAEGLDPERSLTIAQQVGLDIDMHGGNEITAGVNGYATWLRDAYVINERDDFATPEIEQLRENRGTTTVYGVEVELGFNLKNTVQLRAGLTAERAENDAPDEDFNQTRLLRTPRLYAFSEATATLGNFTGRVGLDFTGPMLVPRYGPDGSPLPVETSPNFYDLSANASYRIDARDNIYFEPFFGVRNALQSIQTFDRGVNRDAGYVFGPSQPRTLFVGLKGGI